MWVCTACDWKCLCMFSTGHSLYEIQIINWKAVSVSAQSVWYLFNQSFDLFRHIHTYQHASKHFPQFWSPSTSQEAPLWLPVCVGTISILCHTWSERRSRSCICLKKTKWLSINKEQLKSLIHSTGTCAFPLGCSWVLGELHFFLH